MADLKMEMEGRLTCPECGGNPYTLYRRQVKPGSLVFEHVIWPAHPDVPPPVNPAKLACPNCKEELRRE